MPPTFGGAPKCPRCSKSVYAAEEVLCSGRKYHNSCFTCRTCGRGLDSMTLAEAENDIFCKGCHLKQFGPKGFRGGGAGVTATTGVADPVVVASNVCPSCGKKDQGSFCSECGTKVGGGAVVPEKSSYVPSSAPVKATSSAGGGAKLAFGGGNPKCGKCDKSVYENEKMMGAGKAWHAQCFTCTTCSKGVDSQTMAENSGQLYCKSCHSKNFGPKGFGIGSGATHTQ